MGIFSDEPLMAALHPADRQAVRESATARTFAAGAFLLRQGDQDDFVIVIDSGWVVVRADSGSGRQVVLAIRGPGDIIGEFAAFDGSARSASVVAMTRVSALLLAGARFRRFLNDRPRAAAAVMRGLTLRLRATGGHLQDVATLPVLSRLARLLLDLDGPATLRVPQHQLAASIGASREAVAKALADLRGRGLVRTGGGQVHVLDRTALAVIADL